MSGEKSFILSKNVITDIKLENKAKQIFGLKKAYFLVHPNSGS